MCECVWLSGWVVAHPVGAFVSHAWGAVSARPATRWATMLLHVVSLVRLIPHTPHVKAAQPSCQAAKAAPSSSRVIHPPCTRS